jgi:hypothetical protein
MLNRKHHFAAILKAVISYSTGNQHNESFFTFMYCLLGKLAAAWRHVLYGWQRELGEGSF